MSDDLHNHYVVGLRSSNGQIDWIPVPYTSREEAIAGGRSLLGLADGEAFYIAQRRFETYEEPATHEVINFVSSSNPCFADIDEDTAEHFVERYHALVAEFSYLNYLVPVSDPEKIEKRIVGLSSSVVEA